MARFAKHRAGFRRIGLLAGALALLLQTVAWSMTMPSRSLDGGWITICSAQGLVAVHVDADGAPTGGDDSPQAEPAGSCPLCPLVAGLTLPPPFVEAAAPPVPPGHDAAALPGDRIAAGWFLSSLQARAPPSFA
ncbi:MAG TPA: DUF2946 family protein [Azospirillum sp.]|nr:DUF2946 family protein [Azospirillum sp.]